jgi:hypothetical protein
MPHRDKKLGKSSTVWIWEAWYPAKIGSQMIFLDGCDAVKLSAKRLKAGGEPLMVTLLSPTALTKQRWRSDRCPPASYIFRADSASSSVILGMAMDQLPKEFPCSCSMLLAVAACRPIWNAIETVGTAKSFRSSSEADVA